MPFFRCVGVPRWIPETVHNGRHMTIATLPKRLGFFTRLLDQADPAERYRLATEQIIHAERLGFHSAWIAQHHFHEDEGGLPAPFVFLAQVAAQTTRIRLGTGIVTLPLELPIRVAEDSAVLDLMCGGRLEVGVGGGGNLSSYAAFGQNSAERTAVLVAHLQVLRDAWAGRPLPGGGDRLYPANPSLVERVWQATFSVEGARRAGAAGDGLMLSRTQPRPADAPDLSLAEIQNPMIDAYLEALPAGREPRILASRTVFVADDDNEALRLADIGLGRHRARLSQAGPRDRRWNAGRDDRLHGCSSGNAGQGDRLAPDGQRARPVDGRRGPGAFDRSAASLHPQIDRAGRRGGGARARLGAACRRSPACRVTAEPRGR